MGGGSWDLLPGPRGNHVATPIFGSVTYLHVLGLKRYIQLFVFCPAHEGEWTSLRRKPDARRYDTHTQHQHAEHPLGTIPEQDTHEARMFFTKVLIPQHQQGAR